MIPLLWRLIGFVLTPCGPGPHGAQKKEVMGPKQIQKKGSHFVKQMTILRGCPGSRIFFGGSLKKWIFAEGRSTRSLLCLEKIQGPIWRSKDHLVMKGLSNNVKNHEFQSFHYSVRQKIGDPGSISTQDMFPLISVTPMPPTSPA